MKTLTTAAIAILMALLFAAVMFAIILAASLIHPLAPLGVMGGFVVFILAYVAWARP